MHTGRAGATEHTREAQGEHLTWLQWLRLLPRPRDCVCVCALVGVACVTEDILRGRAKRAMVGGQRERDSP